MARELIIFFIGKKLRIVLVVI